MKGAWEVDSGEHAQNGRHGALRSLAGLAVMIVLVVAITIGLRTFVFVPYEIPSGSMEETIMPGDMVFSEKISYYMREPGYGDIVTFADPNVAGRTLIKRVIATGGQTVDLVDGAVVVDGVSLDEPYTDGKPSYPLDHTALGVDIEYPLTVPEGCLWVMGDNRTASQDSRYFGPIPASSVTGRASMIYWPLSNFRLLP